MSLHRLRRASLHPAPPRSPSRHADFHHGLLGRRTPTASSAKSPAPRRDRRPLPAPSGAELALFGSALRDDFGLHSDLDFLVRFEPGAERPWMGHFEALEDDLSALLGRRVDVVDWNAIERSRNWIRREAILSSAQSVFAA